MHIDSESETPPPLPTAKGNLSFGYAILVIVIGVSAWSYELLTSAEKLLQKLAPGEIEILIAISFAGIFKLTPIVILIFSKILKMVKQNSAKAGKFIAIGVFLSISCSLLLDSLLVNLSMKAIYIQNEKNIELRISKSNQESRSYGPKGSEATTINKWIISQGEHHRSNLFKITYIRTIKGGKSVIRKVDASQTCSVTSQEHSDGTKHTIDFLVDNKTIDSIDAPEINIPVHHNDNNDSNSSIKLLAENYTSKAASGMIIITATVDSNQAKSEEKLDAKNQSFE